jgi:hypothetical protein
MLGTSISYGQPVTATGYNGASVTINMGVQLSQLTGSVAFYLPDLQGTSSYTQANPLANVCVSTMNQNGQQSPGQYSNGYVQAYLYGTVPYQTLNIGYQTVTVVGQNYSGIPVQYAQAQGYINGMVNGTSFNGTAQISIPALGYQNSVQSGGGGYGGGYGSGYGY